MMTYEIRAAQCAVAGHQRVLWRSIGRFLCLACGVSWPIGYDTPEDSPLWTGPRRVEPVCPMCHRPQNSESCESREHWLPVSKLVLEAKGQPSETAEIGSLLLAPPIDEDYWAWRVRLSDRQAIVGFPKFTTIGIGFAVEDDWNTNLPYTCPAEQIYDHIAHNKGDDAISAGDCLAAIRLIQEAAAARLSEKAS